MTGNRGWIVLALILLIVFVYGLMQLFLSRVDQGDIYPYYSSLRSDPLGTRGFYEGLEECCGDLEVSRNYLPFSRIRDQVDAAILVLGIDITALSSVPEAQVEEVDGFVRQGGRLVLAFLPVTDAPDKKDQAPVKDPQKKDEDETVQLVSFHDIWGVSPAYREGDAGWLIPASRQGPALATHSSDQISGHTRLYFDQLAPEWKVLYARRDDAVIMERQLGAGTIVYSAFSYYISNEALVDERHSDLLAWLIGNKHRVIFDEYHHGIYETPGIAFLVRKYEMHWFVLGVILLSLLYIWRETSPFPPFSEVSDISSLRHSVEKDAFSGLKNLLRRNIPEKDLFRLCFEEWKHSHRYLSVSRRSPQWIREEEQDLYDQVEKIATGDKDHSKGSSSEGKKYNAVVRMLKKVEG